MKKLGDLLAPEWLSKLNPELAIAGVTSDSRQVKPGMLFVATTGAMQGSPDGHDFIAQAFSSGAAFAIGEKPGTHKNYLQVSDSRAALSKAAAAYFDHPSRELLVVGVTGTSGKTTTTYFVESILKAAGHETGLIGTISFKYREKVLDSSHTTPGAYELQALFREMKEAGCTAVVMEVSSHALKQRRVADIAFDAVIFTNLSREHLDFHPDMEDYYRSKKILFSELARFSREAGKKPVAAIGADSEFGKRLFSEISGEGKTTFRKIAAFGGAETPGITLDLSGIHGEVDGVRVDSGFTGAFNVSNILGAVEAARALGIAPEVISAGVRNLKRVPGRLEPVPNSRGIHVLVDYAHKPDALEKVLRTLAGIKGAGHLLTVFGCGGDRDRTKRSVMGRLAVELSDRVFITSDNPRTENPTSIIEEILHGTEGHSNFEVEADRKKAIEAAIHAARPGDIVLIAGKGHEDYQIIGKTKIHFDDREIAAALLDA